jgi:hypothetical protein
VGVALARVARGGGSVMDDTMGIGFGQASRIE